MPTQEQRNQAAHNGRLGLGNTSHEPELQRIYQQNYDTWHTNSIETSSKEYIPQIDTHGNAYNYSTSESAQYLVIFGIIGIVPAVFLYINGLFGLVDDESGVSYGIMLGLLCVLSIVFGFRKANKEEKKYYKDRYGEN